MRRAGALRTGSVLRVGQTPWRLLTTAQFAALNKADFERFGKLVRDAEIRIQQ